MSVGLFILSVSVSFIEGFVMQVLGNAVFLGDFEAQSPEWHEVRAGGIGGSDVAAILGLSKWTSAYSLWCKKSGLVPDDFSDNEAMEWGRLLEPVVFGKFAASHSSWGLATTGTWAHKDRLWQVCNPDGLITFEDGSQGILEIKTARYEDDWIVPAEGVVGAAAGVPDYYRTQVQYYLNCFGFDKAYVAVLFSGSKYREFLIPADDFQQDVHLQAVERFRGYVESGTAPDWDGSKSTLASVRAQHPDIVDTEVDLGGLGIELMFAQNNLEFAEEVFNQLKSIVLDAMGSARYGVVVEDGDKVRVASRSARKGGQPFLIVSKRI